tara:strand:+ start:2531 stop:2704 length:174 start_codon:yes stop_codon:yes gene_type:complete
VKLTEQLGHSPSAQELAEYKARKAEKKAANLLRNNRPLVAHSLMHADSVQRTRRHDG